MEKDLNLLIEAINTAENVFGKSFLNDPSFETIGKKETESEKISKKTPPLIKKFRQAKIDIEKSRSIGKLELSIETIEFYQLVLALPLKDCESFFSRIIAKLKSKDLPLFTSACHEVLTRKRYKENNITLVHIDEGEQKTPDFLAKGKTRFYVECKALLSKEKLETPEIESLCKRIQKVLARKKISGVVDITISSKSVGSLTKSILTEFDYTLLNPLPVSKVSDGYEFKFTPIRIVGKPIVTEINIQRSEIDLGRFEFDMCGQVVLGVYGVRIFPIRTLDYSSSLKNQIKKSKAQFSIENINVLHVQFPFIKMESLIDLIESQSKVLFRSIDGSSINALVVEFPYIIDYVTQTSKLYPGVCLPFLNPKVTTCQLLTKNLYWLNHIRIIENKEEMASVFLEFEVNESIRMIFLGIITNDLRYQLRFYIIKNTLLVQFQVSGLLQNTRFELPNSTILERNKMAFNVGAETIAINGSTYKGKSTSHNST
jgi:hypothetical protein